MSFELFSNKSSPGRQRVTVPLVTLNKEGSFILNRAAWSLAACPEWVQLWFDRRRKLVGFRPCSKDDIAAYKVQAPTKGWGSCRVNSAAFIRYIGADTSVSTRYAAYVKDKMLVIDLLKPVSEVARLQAAKEQ